MPENKYKIVCLIHSLGHKGGMQRVAVNLANHWASTGHSVEIWTLRKADSFYAIDGRIPITNLTGSEIKAEKGKILKIFTGMFEIVKSIIMLNRLLLQKKPNILIIHRGGVKDSFVGFQRFYPNQTLELLHMQFDQQPGSFPLYIEIIQSLIFKFLQPKKNLVVLNNATRQRALAAGWTNVFQIPNAVPFLSETKSHCCNPYLISVARDDPKKGLDILIKAFSIVSKRKPSWKLRIIGESITNPKNNVNKLILEYDLKSQVELIEPVVNIQDYYTSSSIYVLSSYTEGMPMVLLEAMECGLPVVSSDIDGIDDVISAECSLKFETGNYSRLAEQLNILIDNEDVRINMGRAASEHVKKFYSDNVNDLWLKLFGKIDHQNHNK